MDVVAHARSVGGGVVVAEHAHCSELSNCNLRNVGHEVVGDALWIFADEA